MLVKNNSMMLVACASSLLDHAPMIDLSKNSDVVGLERLKETRRDLLSGLLDKHGAKKLIEATGFSQAYLWQMAKGKGKSSRGISDENARKIEISMGLGAGWLDGVNIAHETFTNETVSSPEDTSAHNPVRAIRRVRIMGVVKMDSDGYWSSAEAEQGHIRYPTVDPDAYALRIDGDALHPAIRFGWYALVEPSIPPKARDFVLVEVESGRQTIMELISNDGGLRMLHAVNSDKRLTLQPGDERICMRVSSLLTPATPVEE